MQVQIPEVITSIAHRSNGHMQNKATEVNKISHFKCYHKRFIFVYNSNIGRDDLREDRLQQISRNRKLPDNSLFFYVTF